MAGLLKLTAAWLESGDSRIRESMEAVIPLVKSAQGRVSGCHRSDRTPPCQSLTLALPAPPSLARHHYCLIACTNGIRRVWLVNQKVGDSGGLVRLAEEEGSIALFPTCRM